MRAFYRALQQSATGTGTCASGFLVSEGDIEGMVEKLDLLLTYPDEWVDFGSAGRKHVQMHYNIHVEVQKLEGVYREL